MPFGLSAQGRYAKEALDYINFLAQRVAERREQDPAAFKRSCMIRISTAVQKRIAATAIARLNSLLAEAPKRGNHTVILASDEQESYGFLNE